MMDNKTILLAANAAIKAGHTEGFLSYCTDDTKWNFVGEQILEGKEAVRAYMKTQYKEPPKFTVEQLIAEGDFVTAIGKITMKTDGKEATYSYCDVWRFGDGKMVELKAFVIKNNV